MFVTSSRSASCASRRASASLGSISGPLTRSYIISVLIICFTPDLQHNKMTYYYEHLFHHPSFAYSNIINTTTQQIFPHIEIYQLILLGILNTVKYCENKNKQIGDFPGPQPQRRPGHPFLINHQLGYNYMCTQELQLTRCLKS